LEALAHTAGFPFELRESWWWDDASNDLDVNAAIGEVELLQVGRWHYSNAGYQAIALALQETTGRRWDQVVHDVLWVPAGMQNTHLDTMVPPDATVRSAAGGIVTTLEDLCRFGSALAGHHPDLLPPPVLRTLTAPRAIAGPGLIQAAGLQLTVGERTRILSWGTIPDITIGLIVEPGMHSVAMSLDRFAGGEPLRAKLVETSDRLRSGFATTDLGLWWFDGQQIEVSEVEGIVAARDPHSPTCLARARIEDVQISDSRVEFPRITLWREMEDSAW
jgi:CubicO group peptidase (beta-lactamase class C family)